MQPGGNSWFFPVLLAALAMCLFQTALPARANEEEILDPDLFVHLFFQAHAAGDTREMEELARLGEPAVYDAFAVHASAGLRALLEGRNPAPFLTRASLIGSFYQRATGRAGLSKLAASYMGYTRSEASLLFEAHDHLQTGGTLVEQQRPEPALERYRQARTLFQSIGDHDGASLACMYAGSALELTGRCLEAEAEYRTALSVRQDLGDLYGTADMHESVGLMLACTGNHPAALEQMRLALGLWARLKLPERRAFTLRRMGLVHEDRGNPAKAVPLYRESLEIYRQAADIPSQIMVLDYLGLALQSLGRIDEALKCYGQEAALQKDYGDIPEYAETLVMMGIVLAHKGDYTSAGRQYELALKAARSAGAPGVEAGALSGLGLLASITGDFDRAALNLQRALELYRETGDRRGEVTALTSFGNVLSTSGDHEQALALFSQALDRAGEQDVLSRVSILISLGTQYQMLGRYSDAQNALGQAAGLVTGTRYVLQKAAVYSSLGALNEEMGRDDTALQLYRRSASMFGSAGSAAGGTLAFLRLGRLLADMGRTGEALSVLENAQERAGRSGETVIELAALSILGGVYLARGEPDHAMDLFQSALNKAESSGGKLAQTFLLERTGLLLLNRGDYEKALEVLGRALGSAEKLDLRESVWSCSAGIGYALWKSGRPEKAIEPYRRAVSVIEELFGYSSGFSEEERSLFMEDRQHVYREFAELLLEMGYLPEAFTVVEKGKSHLFREMMHKADARALDTGDGRFSGLLQLERELLQESSALRSRHRAHMSGEDRKVALGLAERIASVEQRLKEIEQELAGSYPRYAELRYPAPLRAEELQTFLRKGEAFISYAVCTESVWAFVVRSGSFKVVKTPAEPGEIRTLAADFRTGIDRVRTFRDLEKHDPRVSHRLYQILFQPLESSLKGAQVIFIAADDVLYTLPFEALVTSLPEKSVFDQARKEGRRGLSPLLNEYSLPEYLLGRYEIGYLPAGSVLRSLRRFTKQGYGKWSRQLIGFADPVFESKEPASTLRRDALLRASGKQRLVRLADSGREAKAASAAVGGAPEDLYLRGRATEMNVRSAPLAEARYLLFATHGFLGGDFTGVTEPSLALSLVGNPPGVDGFLSMGEVLGLDLNAELVVLSACSTSGRSGRPESGEGFAGLARSFMYAGARNLMVTLWSVDSGATESVVTGMFERIAGQISAPGPALSASKRVLMHSERPAGKSGRMSLAHPFFWGPFVLVGGTD
jgi:tetratricopeptide (TPR) repeat protein